MLMTEAQSTPKVSFQLIIIAKSITRYLSIIVLYLIL